MDSPISRKSPKFSYIFKMVKFQRFLCFFLRWVSPIKFLTSHSQLISQSPFDRHPKCLPMFWQKSFTFILKMENFNSNFDNLILIFEFFSYNKYFLVCHSIYGWNFSRLWFCQKLVTFSLTLSINYSIFFNGMVKTKTFPMISLKRRVIIYVSFFHKLAICLSICLSIFCILGLIRITLWAPEYK